MRRFLVRCALFIGPFILGLLAWGYAQRAFLPAPRFTANVAINEKVRFIARRIDQPCAVLAVGSSMALNNLASDRVVAHFGTDHFLNAGAWGAGTTEAGRLGAILAARLRPRAVILVTNLMDFLPGSPFTAADSAAVADHLRAPTPLAAYLRHRDLAYYLRQTGLNRMRFTDAANYEYLGFDAHGAAPLQVPADRMDERRYQQLPPRADELQGERYAALDRFARGLRAQGIDMLVLLSPYRPGLESVELERAWMLHLRRLHAILDPLGHLVVDGRAMPRTDDLYCDASHFNRHGAESFTRWALARSGAFAVSGAARR